MRRTAATIRRGMTMEFALPISRGQEYDPALSARCLRAHEGRGMKGTSWIDRVACVGLSGVALGAAAGRSLAQAPAATTPDEESDRRTRSAATVNGEVITFAQREPILKASGPLPV